MNSSEYLRETIDVVRQIETRFLELGARLYSIKEKQLWRETYDSFPEFLKAAKISEGMASILSSIHKNYIVEGNVDAKRLEGAGYSNLYESIPFIETEGIESAVIKAQTLSRSEIIKEKREVVSSLTGDEIVYVLRNEAMPGYVKVGFTRTSLEERIRSLDTTGVPLPFECFYAARVKNCRDVEKLLHDAFLNNRVRSNREFFEIAPERIVSAIKLAEIENITPKKDFVESEEDQKALNEAREKRSAFNFGMVNIPIGSEIVFVNDENIRAKVVKLSGKRSIEFNGEMTSPSTAAQKVLGYAYNVQGTVYWMYQGETLDERRRRLEGEE
ncbi:MAG: hypothetical protein QG633_70 [Patescibacteria group bacterium]|jgi:hypothetical protein|nr:hypothetical protein [Patescibacteria group bacterium]